MGSEPLSGDPLAPNGPASGWSELELDTAALESGSVPVPTHDPAAQGGGRLVGDPFGGLGGDIPEPELELELDDVGSSRRPSLPVPDLPTPFPPAGAAVERAPGARGAPGIDQVEVITLADYGEPPASFVAWIPYAILVATRRNALKKALAVIRRLESVAKTDAQEALVALGRGLHAKSAAEALSPLRQQLAMCDESGEIALGRTQQLEKSREAAEAQRAALKAKIEQAEGATGPYRDRETKLSTQMATRDNDLRRAKAKQTRVEIELRNLRQAADRGDGGIDAPRLELLEAQLQACRADTEKAQGYVSELEPQLATARKELAVMLSAVNELEKQRRAIDQAQDRSDKVHLSTAGEAERVYHDAVQALAEAALDRGLAASVEPSLARSAEMMRRAVASREREIELHLAALEAYDKGAFQKGWAVIAGAALVVLAMVVFIIVR